MDFNLIVSSLDKYGFSFLVSALFIYFSIILANIGITYLKKKIKLDSINLKDHELFSKIMNYMVNDVENIYEGSYDSKNNMAKDYLKITFYLFKLKFTNLLNSIDIKESEKKIYNKILDFITEYTNDCQGLAVKIWISELFLNKYNYYNKNRFNLIKWSIERIINNEIYDNTTKMSIIMDNYIREFEGMLFDAKNTLRDINGELKSVEYNKKLNSIKDIEDTIKY